MTTKEQIDRYIADQAEPKRDEIQQLHALAIKIAPKGKLWFADGKDASGKTVANPSIGYGAYTITYANGSTKEFYRVGVSGNSTGISVYILGLDDKKYLTNTYGKRLGKASVTGYCIKFRSLKDVDIAVLEEAMRHGLGTTSSITSKVKAGAMKKTTKATRGRK